MNLYSPHAPASVCEPHVGLDARLDVRSALGPDTELDSGLDMRPDLEMAGKEVDTR